ncbi:hypothetical protein [Spirillospora albida]|uniref:hypothetical protein n=1 Tax=Spirillospora albida TaxID=58123 RepID=UPI0004BF8EE8|nr:hypothetical protein [Spirillospora albida]
MTARILVLRPGAVPVPSQPSAPSSSSHPSSSIVPPVRIGWDDLRGLHVAVCDRCTDTYTSPSAGDVEDWADSHRCDAEMAALLTLVTSRRAA